MRERTKCERCPEGWSQTDQGQSACSICTTGKYETDRTACKPCDAGTFVAEEEASACRECPSGHFCVEGSAEPEECIGGEYQAAPCTTVTDRICPNCTNLECPQEGTYSTR